jgi:hypothetical protein
MTIKDVLIRFSLTYVALLITVFLISALLKYVGVSIPSLGIFILIMSTFYTCQTFAKKNKRYFTNEEEKQVIIGFFIINLIVEGILSALGAIAGTLRGTALLIAIGLVVIINPIIIYIFVGLAKINLKKRGIIVE